MIKFLLKGILRDKSKSLIPICVISLGVFITVFMSGFVEGVLSEMISSNANLDTGHLKIMTKPYKENKDQLPNDLALLEIDLLIDSLINRVEKDKIEEVILATSATIEGQTTAYYIQESLKNSKVKITKLAQGLPVGGEIENLDDGTLISAFKNRSNLISNSD